MKRIQVVIGIIASTILSAQAAAEESLIWGVQVEQLEHRFEDTGDDILAWDFDALVGSDELKLVWRSEAEYETESSKFETLENQLRLQTPISTFYDVAAGIRLDNPKGIDRVSGVVGLHGLAEQWFEIDADVFLSEDPSARFEIEYEGLITNYITLTPSVEIDIPFTDDEDFEKGAWAPTVEIGARLGYDLEDRLIAPYIGVHYERSFGETANIADANGEDSDSLYLVTGVRLMF
jgi:copper resistance protein B